LIHTFTLGGLTRSFDHTPLLLIVLSESHFFLSNPPYYYHSTNMSDSFKQREKSIVDHMNKDHKVSRSTEAADCSTSGEPASRWKLRQSSYDL